jgi:ATP-dependent DNA helicase RecG
MLFWNPGDAYADELLASTEKEVRNPLLIDAFRRIGLGDRAGTGIRAIYRNWLNLGHRQPEINSDKAAKSFELILDKAPAITENLISRVEQMPEAHDQAHDQAHDLTKMEIVILQSCLLAPQSSADLLAILGYRTRTGNFKKAMAHLIDDLALLARTLPNTHRSKHQKYRLTPAGKHLLASIQ